MKRNRLLNEWGRNLTRAERYASLSAILFEVGEYKASADVALQAVKFVRSNSGRLSRAWFYRQAANALKVYGNFARALSCAMRAAKQCAADPYELASAWNIVGVVHLEKEHFDAPEAAKAFRKAIHMLQTQKPAGLAKPRREKIQLLRCRLQNNLGLSIMYSSSPKGALMSFNKSITIKDKIGDVIGTAHTLSNIAVLHYRNKN